MKNIKNWFEGNEDILFKIFVGSFITVVGISAISMILVKCGHLPSGPTKIVVLLLLTAVQLFSVVLQGIRLYR